MTSQYIISTLQDRSTKLENIMANRLNIINTVMVKVIAILPRTRGYDNNPMDVESIRKSTAIVITNNAGNGRIVKPGVYNGSPAWPALLQRRQAVTLYGGHGGVHLLRFVSHRQYLACVTPWINL